MSQPNLITDELSEEELSKALERYVDQVEDAGDSRPESEVVDRERYRYLRPLSDTADNLIEVLQNNHGRFFLGLREIDVMTRGIARGELALITGFAHSGKTQVLLNAIVKSPESRVCFFTFDEPAELVLAKLVALKQGRSYEKIEEQIKAGNRQQRDEVRQIAREELRNLLVFDESLSCGQMSQALEEARDYWGAPVDAVGIDYLELLQSDEDDVSKKAQMLKRWVGEEHVPVLCLHQGSRGNSGHGQEITMQSMKYGGEQEATFVIGVRRKRDDEKLDEFQRNNEANTVTVNLPKNKRPPSRKGSFDYFLHPETGLIRELLDSDYPRREQ